MVSKPNDPNDIKHNDGLDEVRKADIYVRGVGTLPCIAYRADEVFKESDKYKGYLIGNRGTIYDTYKKRKLSLYEDKGAFVVRYPNYNEFDHKHNTELLSKMVLRAHCPIENDENMVTKYHDGDKSNVYYSPTDPNSNIYWCTMSDNIRDSISHNKDGKYNDYNLYTDDQIRTVIKMLFEHKKTREIAETIGTTMEKATALISKLRAGVTRKDILKEFPPIPNIQNVLTEEVVRTICERLVEGIPVSKIAKMLEEEGNKVSEVTIRGLRRKNPRFSKKWMHILNEYDFESSNTRVKLDITEAEAEKICQLIQKGMIYRDIYIATGMVAKNIPLESFITFCTTLKANNYIKFQHISSKYFN